MRLSPVTGQGLMGQGGTTISIDGAIPPSLSTASGGGWGWLDDDTCAGQANLGAGYLLRQLIVSTDTLSVLDATPTGEIDAANQFRAGGSHWAAFMTAGALVGVRSDIHARLPLAALGDMDTTGRLAVVQNYQADAGIVVYNSAGAQLWVNNATVTDGTNRLRMKDGSVAYEDTSGNWHLRSATTGALQSFAPRTDETIALMVPVSISGVIWVVELSSARLTIRPATSSNGYVLATSANLFGQDAIELTPGTVRVGWSVTTGEAPTDLRMADLTVGTGTGQSGTTAGGSLVFTSATFSSALFTVGPVEGGTLAANKQPRQAIRDEAFVNPQGKATYQRWWDQLAGQAFAPPNAAQFQGILDPAHGGTGVTTGLTVLNGANILPGTTPLTALVDETESTLLGRGQGSGDGPPEEITLGAGLTMTGTVLSATAASTSSWIPLVDGSEPPNFITDGAGHLILVAYP